MDRFVVPPRDDAKRQWGQSPEIEDSTESMDEPITPRYAMSGFHIKDGRIHVCRSQRCPPARRPTSA